MCDGLDISPFILEKRGGSMMVSLLIQDPTYLVRIFGWLD